MKIVVDENMPHAVELFAEFGEVVPLPGREIKAADLQEADVLLVRSVTKVNAELLSKNNDFSPLFLHCCSVIKYASKWL